MTKTIQPRSWKTALYATDNDLQIQKTEAEKTEILMCTLLENLENLQKMYNILLDLAKKNNSLCVAGLPYLQEIKKLTVLTQDKEKGEKK